MIKWVNKQVKRLDGSGKMRTVTLGTNGNDVFYISHRYRSFTVYVNGEISESLSQLKKISEIKSQIEGGF